MKQHASRAIWAVAAAALFTTIFTGLAQAATPTPEVVKGTAWLQAQVKVDGTLANEAASIATPLQNRAESLQTFKLLATVPSALADQLAADTADNTEYLARRAVALSLAGRDASAITAQLATKQNTDGGFGGGAGYKSSTLDTAWVMLAMAQNTLAGTPAGQAARGYLLTTIQSDGGVGTGSGSERINASALALLALQMYPQDLNTATALKNISAWLLIKQGADGSWLGNSNLTALTLAAVSPLVSDPTIGATAQTYLKGLQGTDGSWGAGDPFLTAVVLRALTIGASTAPAVTSTITGLVVDQNTATALSGAAVALSGAATATLTTGMDGKISIPNLAAGSYTLQISKAGYIAYTNTYQLNTSQTLNIGTIVLGQTLATGIVGGQITSAATGLPLSGVSVILNGAASAVTDANGLYSIANVTPGAVTLSASLAGYTASTGTGNVLGGQTLVYSPALYAAGVAVPTTGHFTGKVTASGSGAPLAGVGIQLNGAAAGVTAADGSFNLTLPASSYTAAFTLAGYNSATSTFLLTAGGTINAGIIALIPQLTSTTISGIVRDATSGNPISGAQVQELSGTIATSGTDGVYTLAGLAGASFDLRVSATGYVTQSMHLMVNQPGKITLDFPLQVQTGLGLSLSSLMVNPPSAASHTDISIGAVVANAATGTPVSAILTMQVVDAQSNVVSTAISYDKTGTNMLGVFSINPGQQLPVMYRWNTGQFPPGVYSLIARVVEAGSVSQTNSSGRILTEAKATQTITADQHFVGTITANPPVLQVNTNIPVHLSAILANDGNANMPAQAYQLQIISEQTGVVVATQQANVPGFAPSALQSVTFADWIPTAGGGNFRIELQAAATPSMGKVIGKVYVGDAATAVFTVNKLAVPAGTQAIKGNIHVFGQDNGNGTISDPLAPLIKAAIQKAVTYNDLAASNWTLQNGCAGCHIQSQALVGGEMTRLLTNYDVVQRRTINNMLAESQQSDGSFYTNYPQFRRTQTMLGLWALTSVHNKNDIVSTLAKGADYLINTQSADGSWYSDDPTAWWTSLVANTGFNLKSLISVRQTMAQAPAGSAGNYSLMPWASGNVNALCAAGFNGDQKYTVGDAAGNIYISCLNAGTVSVVMPDGTVKQLMSGLYYPTQMVLAADGSLYVVTGKNLLRRAPDGTVTTVTPYGGTALTLGPDGNLYMANPWVTTIYQITPQGGATIYASGWWVGNATGVAFDSLGNLLIQNNTQVIKYKTDKTYETINLNGWLGGFISALIQDGSGWLVGTNNGIYRYDSDWNGVKLVSAQNIRTLSRMPNGKVIAGDNYYLYTLEKSPYSLQPKINGTLIPGIYKASTADAAGNIYVTSGGDYSGTLSVVRPDGTVKTLLSSILYPRQPAFASDGSLYIPTNFGVIRYSLSTGQTTTLTTTGVTTLALGPDGNMYGASYWSNKILQITPAGTVSDYIVGGALNNPYAIAFDKSGAMLVSNVGTGNVVKYNADKTYSVVIPSTNGGAYYILPVGTDCLVATANGVFRYDSAWQGALLTTGLAWALSQLPDGNILVGDPSDTLSVLRQVAAPAQLDASIFNATNWLLIDSNIDTYSNLDLAHRLIGLGEANKYYAGIPLATTIQAKMATVGAMLKSRQLPDGGWGWTKPVAVSDSMVTAQVGMALDYLNPSASDPVVQNAVKLLLGRQQADGSWISENGILNTHLAATTWVAIWLPIALNRIGGINTDMTVSMPANVSLGNPSIAPTSSAANAAGGTDYLWKLQGVQSAGVDINFDLSLANMVLGETRPVASNAYLTFNNSFTGLPVNAPIAIPRVTASAFLGLGVNTDQTNYGANSPVNITAAINNTSVTGPLDGSVKLEIYGADNFLVTVAGTRPFTALAAGAQTSQNATWGTGTIAAGSYYVLATLYDAQNRQAGTAKTAFNIISGIGAMPGATGVGAKITTDKPAYQAYDRIQLASRITNLTQNQVQSGLQAVITITRPDGTIQWTQTAPLQQLLAGAFIDLGASAQLNNAPAGQYSVTLSVQTTGAAEIARTGTTYNVLSSALTGSGLKGTIAAYPKIVPQTDPVIMNWTASDLGNADFAALPITVSIIDPVTQQLMAQQAFTVAVAQGQTYQTAYTWATDTASVGSTYIAILAATVAGKTIVLAQDNFLVTEPPVRLDVKQSTVRENRVLVWLACTGGEEQKAADDQKAAHQDDPAAGQKSGNDGKIGDREGQPPIPACIKARTAYVDTLLTAQNVPHLITANRDDFKKAFREGKYNVYWLSGDLEHGKTPDGQGAANQDATNKDGASKDGASKDGASKDGVNKGKAHGETDDESLFEEIREAVNRGDGLILDGAQQARPMQETAGLSYGGQLPKANLPLTTTGLLFAVGQMPTQGDAQKIHITTGTSQANFDIPVNADDQKKNDDQRNNDGQQQNDGQQKNDGQNNDQHGDDAKKPAPVWPAIMGNDYGKGHALAFGFDLVDTLQNSAMPPAWATLLQTGLTHLLPPLPETYSAGAYVEMATGIQNLARTVDLSVTTQLPPGTTLLQTVPLATLDANGQPNWLFTLPAATGQTLQLTMRLPDQTGDYTARTFIDSIRNGKNRRYGEYDISWMVAANDPQAAKLASDLKTLRLTGEEENEARDAAVAKLAKAEAYIAGAQYGKALKTLLGAVDKLRKITSVDISSYRLVLDSLLQETAWNWLRTGGDKELPEAAHQEKETGHLESDARQKEKAAQHQQKNADNK